MPENFTEFHQKLILTNEARFLIDGYLNKPMAWKTQKLLLKSLSQPHCVTFWCILSFGGVIVLYFSETEPGETSNETNDILKEKFPDLLSLEEVIASDQRDFVI